MATVDISEISVTRTDPSAPPPRVQISEVAVVRTIPVQAPTVQISAVSVTRGIAPSAGGVKRRVGGAWVPYIVKARYNGEWI